MSSNNRFKKIFEGPVAVEEAPPGPAPRPLLHDAPVVEPAPAPGKLRAVTPPKDTTNAGKTSSVNRKRAFSAQATQYSGPEKEVIPRHLRPDHASVTAILPKGLIRLARFHLPDNYTLPDLLEELLATWVDKQK